MYLSWLSAPIGAHSLLALVQLDKFATIRLKLVQVKSSSNLPCLASPLGRGVLDLRPWGQALRSGTEFLNGPPPAVWLEAWLEHIISAA